MRRHLALLAVPLLSAGLAATPAPAPAQTADPYTNCKCRANGRTYRIGERACLSTARGYRVAECRMQQNVTNWSPGAEGCPPTAGVAGAVASG